MVNLRPKLVVQSQSQEPESRALCGLLSINNALQEFNFLDMRQMATTLRELEESMPGDDHGCTRNGHYSILAFQHTLRKKGYALAHLNNVQFLYKKAKKEWAGRLMRSSFTRLLIVGRPDGQADNIYHCIASTMFQGERFLIDPDEGQRAKMTQETLHAFMPTISSVYAILTLEETVKYRVMFQRARKRAAARRERHRLASIPSYPTLRQRHYKAKEKNRKLTKDGN